MNSCVCPFGSLRTLWRSHTFSNNVPDMGAMVLRLVSEESAVRESAVRPLGARFAVQRQQHGSVNNLACGVAEAATLDAFKCCRNEVICLTLLSGWFGVFG